MSCQDFERRLEAWLAGELPEAQRSACEDHLGQCARCRTLAELAALTADPESLPADLLPGILAETSGPVCDGLRDELVVLVDGHLGASRRESVEAHLEHCPSCRDVRGVLLALKEDLPAMAELDPGPAFTREVLARTRGSRSRPRTLVRRLRRRGAELWGRWVRRPRFAWELAYVLLLVVMPWIGRVSTPMASGAQSLATGAGEIGRHAAQVGARTGNGARTFGAGLASSLEKAAGEELIPPPDTRTRGSYKESP